MKRLYGSCLTTHGAFVTKGRKWKVFQKDLFGLRGREGERRETRDGQRHTEKTDPDGRTVWWDDAPVSGCGSNKDSNGNHHHHHHNQESPQRRVVGQRNGCVTRRRGPTVSGRHSLSVSVIVQPTFVPELPGDLGLNVNWQRMNNWTLYFYSSPNPRLLIYLLKESCDPGVLTTVNR